MKLLIIISFLTLAGCGDRINKEKKPTTDSSKAPDKVVKEMAAPAVCTLNFDTTLVRLAKSFHATDLHITQCMSIELNQFMLHVDTNCLRKQKMYPFFINAILAKVVLYQLTCCDQHYEMRYEENGAKVILNEFKIMAGFRNKQIEFLSSAEVEVYIQKTPDLQNNAYLKAIMIKIKKQTSRIVAGDI